MQTDQMNALQPDREQNTPTPHIFGSIQQIPALLAECLDEQYVEQAEAIARQLTERNIRKIFLLGTGSSYFASISESYAFEQIASIPAEAIVSSAFRAYPPCDLNAQSAVFFHSHSGKTEGDLDSVKLAKAHGAYTVGVTDIATSPLAAAVDDVLLGPGGPKFEMPATRTHVTALFRMIFLATRLAGAGADGGNTLRRQDFDALPEQVAALMAGCQSRAAEIVDKMRDCPTLITVGYGPNSATAAEAAMAFNQSAGIPSQSYELDNFIHGPIQALKPGMGVFVIAAPGPMVDKSLALAHACKILGATVVVLSAQGDRASDDHADAYIAMPQGVPDLLSSVAYMVPFWQIAYEFGSLGKGCQPDRLSMDKPEFKTALGYLMHQDKWVTQ